MKSSDSTTSLSALNEVEIEADICFICLDTNKEPLVSSKLLRRCGCVFIVHPECWNTWLVGKSVYDCPICHKASMTSGVKPLVFNIPHTEVHYSYKYKAMLLLVCSIILSGFLIHEMIQK